MDAEIASLNLSLRIIYLTELTFSIRNTGKANNRTVYIAHLTKIELTFKLHALFLQLQMVIGAEKKLVFAKGNFI